MGTIGRTTTTLLATLAMTLGAACASSPEIPEEDESSETKSYRSAQSDDNASSDQNSERQKQGQSQQGESNAGRTAQPGGPAEGGGQSGNKPSGPPEATGPVATVDGEPISAEAFNEEIKKIAKSGKFPPAVLHRFKGRLIDRLIDQQLIDDAIANSSVDVADEEVDKKLEQVRSEFDQAQQQRQRQSSNQQRGKPQSLEQLAGQYGISSDELRKSIRRSIAIEKLLMGKGVEEPTDSEVRQFYDNNPDKFTKPEQVHARHILVKVEPGSGDAAWNEAKEKIEKIHDTATSDGTDFGELARDKSDGPSAKNGGDIGFISQKQFDENFTKAAFDLEKGEISEPVKTRYGWHIIKLVDRRESRTVPFEEVKGKLSKQLKNKRVHEKLQSYIEELRKDAEIKKHPENVE